ncbi:MAG: ATP-binding protein, partial [Actinomycetota bacterium]
AIAELLGDVQQVVDRHGICFLGTDVDRDGGKIILTAGAPTASGDDEERMLLALREIVDRDRVLPIRVGVNRAHVFAGDIGPPYRRTYTVMGDAVNLAARLMAKASPGEILTTDAVLQRSRTRFESVALEPFMVKGKSEPVQAFALGAVARAEDVESENRIPLIGREQEMNVLLSALASARQGQGRLVEIIGEPGIGKSRLIEELRDCAEDLRYLSLACELYDSSTPYRPFRAFLRVLYGIGEIQDDASAARRLEAVVFSVAPDLAPWVSLLAIPLGIDVPATREVLDLDDEFRRERLERATCTLLSALLDAPTLWTLEDVHWMDEASAQLLRKLTSGLAGRPWLMCVTRRDVDEGFVAAPAPHVASLRPEPLDEAAAAALAEAVTEGMPLAPHEMAALAQRSGGNPFYLQE